MVLLSSVERLEFERSSRSMIVQDNRLIPIPTQSAHFAVGRGGSLREIENATQRRTVRPGDYLD